jgi:hypothetical protein
MTIENIIDSYSETEQLEPSSSSESAFVSIVNAKTLQIAHLQVDYDAADECLVYHRTLRPGSGQSFYGLTVCRSLHLPQEFMDNAFALREKYHKNASILAAPTSRYNSQKIRGLCEICGQKMGEETHHLIPQKSADQDGKIVVANNSNTENLVGKKDFPYMMVHKNARANLASVCSECHDKIHYTNSIVLGETTKTTNGNSVRKKTTKGYKLMNP